MVTSIRRSVRWGAVSRSIQFGQTLSAHRAARFSRPGDAGAVPAGISVNRGLFSRLPTESGEPEVRVPARDPVSAAEVAVLFVQLDSIRRFYREPERYQGLDP